MSKKLKPALSKGILEMKFMKRTKEKFNKEQEVAEGREMYANEITDKMLNSSTNFIIDPSYIHCENLIEGRLSFRGMNPEIERLLELEQQERDAAKEHEQPKEVSDKDMATFYHKNQAPAATKTLQKKFQTKKKRKNPEQQNGGSQGQGNQGTIQGKPSKQQKFQKPKEDSDED